MTLRSLVFFLLCCCIVQGGQWELIDLRVIEEINSIGILVMNQYLAQPIWSVILYHVLRT